MFCIYIKEAATKQEFNRSRSLKFSLQQEQELEPELIFQEQDWIRSQTFWTPITSAPHKLFYTVISHAFSFKIPSMVNSCNVINCTNRQAKLSQV